MAMRLKLDHIGIAVDDLAETAGSLRALGLHGTESGQLGFESMQGYPGLNARWAFYGSGKGRAPILLLQPLSREGPISGFLDKKGAGVQHLAFSVENLDIAYETLLEAGFRFARPNPFIDPEGNRSHFFSLPQIPTLTFELIQWAKRPG
jgi:methylmalonyl-CoA/ethylmalonyl-CoA epimerase